MSFKKNSKFSEAYSLYFPLVFSLVFNKINSRTDAEDITQDIFILLYQKFDEVKNIRKWLYGTLRIHLIKYYREKKNNEIDIEEAVSDTSMAFVNGFKDVRIILKEAIDNIEQYNSEEDKTLFELIAVHQFSFENASKQLGFTYKKVRYRYTMISKTIQAYLKKKGISSLEDLL